MTTPTVSARWRRSQIAERFARTCLSASCYRRAEDIGVLAIVEAELELREVERQVLLAHVVEAAYNASFEQRPERFDGVRVGQSNYVLFVFVIDTLMAVCSRKRRYMGDSSVETSRTRLSTTVSMNLSTVSVSTRSTI